MAGRWGQTRDLGDRTLDPADLTRRGLGGQSRPWHPEMGTGTMSDIPVRNVQRETFNSQRPMVVTERGLVGGIWGQTRSYGDTYHWAFHDGTVESVSAVPVFFFEEA